MSSMTLALHMTLEASQMLTEQILTEQNARRIFGFCD